MCKNVLKIMMATLLMALSASFVNAQVHVGDIFCEGDLDGYKGTGVILENRSDHPAFNALDYENGWYLPTAGQLKRLYSKHDKVNESLSAVGGDELFPEDPNWECWSSTEYNVASAWYMKTSGELRCKDATYNGTKDAKRVVRGVINF